MPNLIEALDDEDLTNLLGRPFTLPPVREQTADDNPDAWVVTRGSDWTETDVPADVRETVTALIGRSERDLYLGPALSTAERWVVVADPSEDSRSGSAAHRRALTAVGRALRKLPLKQIVVAHRDMAPDLLAAQVEGLRIGWFRFPRQRPAITPQILVPAAALPAEALLAATLASQATCLTHLWVEEAPNRLTPVGLAGQAAELGRLVGLQVEVVDLDGLKKMGAGGMLAVGQGSVQTPYLVLLQHRPDEAPEFGLVGKGITFDSGGISLKPASNMAKLKGDNAGAAAVLAAALAAAQMGSEIPFLAVLPLAENLPDGRAYRPGDVITMLDGSTVDVVSTDAEGRMVLADGLAVARQRDCRRLVTLATLTKACIVALGYFRGALYATEEDLANRLIAAGDQSGEHLWRMPLDADYARLLHSPVADLAHSSQLAGGGSIVAAKFLQHFVADQPWAHIDMSSIFYLDSEMPWADKGYTGSGARLLLRLLNAELATYHFHK